MTTPVGLGEDLARVGAPTDLWELVNSKKQYKAAIPVLVDWLRRVDERVPEQDRERVREGLVRALTVPSARRVAAPVLIEQFRQVADPSGLGPRWVIGNALEVVADESVVDDLVAIVRDGRFGKARQMVVLGLGRLLDERVVPLLIELLDDDDVAAHAAIVLGKLKAEEARPALERQLVESAAPLVRREAKKALARLG